MSYAITESRRQMQAGIAKDTAPYHSRAGASTPCNRVSSGFPCDRVKVGNLFEFRKVVVTHKVGWYRGQG